MKLYSIFYTGDICGNPKTFEGVTDNFEKWLEWSNTSRGALDEDDPWNDNCDLVETADDFEVEEVALYLYNKENTDV